MLREIAHARAGDKGNTSNISLWARDPADYPLLRDQVTADAVKAHFGDQVKGEVVRHELPHLHGLNFVLREALDMRRRIFGPDNLRTMLTQSAFGACLSALDRHEEAEPLLLSSWRVVDPTLRDGEAEKVAARARIAALYRARGNVEEAAKWER